MPPSHVRPLRPGIVLLAALCLSLLSGDLRAQGLAWDTPAYQTPYDERGLGLYLTSRDPGSTTGVSVTWRRPTGQGFSLGFRGGVADASGSAALFGGAELKGEITGPTPSFPLAVAWVAGGGIGTAPDAGATTVRFPGGVSIGRAFTEGQVTMIPYIHPRLAANFFFRDPPLGDDGELSFDLDLGFDVLVKRSWAFRFGASLADSEALGVGVRFPNF